MSNYIGVIQELQLLAEAANALTPESRNGKGGYFALYLPDAGPVPDLALRIGTPATDLRSSHAESVEYLGNLLLTEPKLTLTSQCGHEGAIRTPNKMILSFAGYESPWNELLMLALAVRMNWLRYDTARELSGPNKSKLMDLLNFKAHTPITKS